MTKFLPVRANPDLDIHPTPPVPWDRVAVCCMWWPSRRGRREWPNAAAVAPLRTPEGIDELARNLLANPQVGFVVVVGPDSLDGKPATTALGRFVSGDFADVGPDVPRESLETLRQIVFIKSDEVSRQEDLDRFYWARLENHQPRNGGRPMVYPMPAPIVRAPAPHGDPGERVAADTLSGLWPRALRTAMSFGRTVDTQYGPTREYLNLVSVIRDPVATVAELDPSASELGQTVTHYYRNNLVCPEAPEGSPYGYGSRMRSGAVDQLDKVLGMLRENSATRAAFVTPWDPAQDSGLESGRPCLTGAWFRVAEEHLHGSISFRSHDLWGGYPKNLGAFCMLLVDWARELGVGVGTLTCVSASAHVYERHWNQAEEVAQQARSGMRWDQRSNWRVERIEEVQPLPEVGSVITWPESFDEGFSITRWRVVSYASGQGEAVPHTVKLEPEDAFGRALIHSLMRDPIRPPSRTLLRAVAMEPGGSGRVVGVFEARSGAGLQRKIEESGLVTEISNALWLGSEIMRAEAGLSAPAAGGES